MTYRRMLRRRWPVASISLTLAILLPVASIITAGPAQAGWVVRAWSGSPNEARLPSRQNPAAAAPDIKLPPGYGDDPSSGNLPIINNTSGDALPPGMNFSLGAAGTSKAKP